MSRETSQLQRLSLPSDLNKLASLASPEELNLSGATPKTLTMLADKFYSMWRQLCTSIFPDGAEVARTDDGQPYIRLLGEKQRSQAVWNAAVYYDYILQQLLATVPVGSRNQQSIPSLFLHTVDSWAPSRDGLEEAAGLAEQVLSEHSGQSEPIRDSAEEAQLLVRLNAVYGINNLQMMATLMAKSYLTVMSCLVLQP
jgi:hypothetical protein